MTMTTKTKENMENAIVFDENGLTVIRLNDEAAPTVDYILKVGKRTFLFTVAGGKLLYNGTVIPVTPDFLSSISK